ncbi:MAG: glucose-6-phosphate isomerase [Pseudomonadota bacterium]
MEHALWDELGRIADTRPKITDLFDKDPTRASDFSVKAGNLLFDYSKTQITADARSFLISMAEAADVAAKRDAMFSGAKINETEGRAVLHTLLRNQRGGADGVPGQDYEGVQNVRADMERFAEQVRSGSFKGQGGAITDVINVGIGGSDLGPKMGTIALAPYHDGPRVHYVSNVDGADIADTLKRLDPTTTLVIVASKTFTTIETMTNARTAFAWMKNSVENPAAQFAAVSTAEEKTAAFGISPDRVFGFEDWVGGRYSMWGPIGLPMMIAIGPENFCDFLAGGDAMDMHFQEAPLQQNMPVMLALVGIWHNQGCGHATRAVLPYDNRLARLPAYLQQLEMESNGKSVAMDGSALPMHSGPVVWGEPGTNGQHAFYQLIHQGTRVIPCEFLVAAKGHEADLPHHHELLVANCLAQSEALMVGRSFEEAQALMTAKGLEGAERDRQARHRVFPGNRPSTTLLYPQLAPRELGMIIALYEHRVFVEGVMLGINSFDQWGVELGKELANALTPILKGEESDAGKDGSTRQLLAAIKSS